MSTTTPNPDSSIDAPTMPRDAGFFEFSVPSEGIAVVRNVRHDDPEAHTYAVNVGRDGRAFRCSCPSDRYRSGACKHIQAVSRQPAVTLAASTRRA